MANTNIIKKEIEPEIAKFVLKQLDASNLGIKKIIGIEPDIIASKGNTLIFGEITTSGYLGSKKSDYHRGGTKKIDESFAKFSLLIYRRDEVFEYIYKETGNIFNEIICYFIVPKKSKFLTRIGYRESLFNINVMELLKIDLPIALEELLVSTLESCKKEMMGKNVSDDEYLRSIDGMVQSIQEARREPDCNGVTLDKLEW